MVHNSFNMNPSLSDKKFKLIDFQAFDNRSSHDDDEEDENNGKKEKKKTPVQPFMIQMYGIDEEGATCSISVNDYNPFFYVKVGDTWGTGKRDTLLCEIKAKIDKTFRSCIIGSELVEYNKLYGFTGDTKSKFVKFVFKNLLSMNSVKRLWRDNIGNAIKMTSQKCELHLYESTLPPLLRYFHIYNISPSGWICVRDHERFRTNDKIVQKTTCMYEYTCTTNDIIPMMTMDTMVPYKICSFDIEASSSHGDFPVPVKSYKRLAVNLIDKYTIQKGSILSHQLQSKLIKRIINTAFGFDNFEYIDRVYPKLPVTEESILNLMTRLHQYREDSISSDVISVMTVESSFKSMREREHEREMVECFDMNDLGELGTDEVREVKKKRILSKKSETSRSLLDILNETIERDVKVNKISEIMTQLLPPLRGDEVTFIGSTFLRYGESEPYLTHCLVVNSCDDVPGVMIESVATERELLLKWAKLIQDENPDIIIGYNIFGFDYDFMFHRACETDCVKEFLKLSRNKNEVCGQIDKVTHALSMEHTKTVFSTGEYDLKYPKIPGRLQIDMYMYFRRDYNLSSYKLDDVVGEYISDDVQDVKYTTYQGKNVTALYTQNISGLHVYDYIRIETIDFSSNYLKDGFKFRVIDINVESDTKIVCIEGHHDIYENNNTNIKVKWSISKDDVTPQQIFQLTSESSKGRSTVAKYCIQDCNLVLQLFKKMDVVTGYIEMSRICSVPMSYLVFRGQGIKLTSYVAKKCREKGTLMPDIEKSFDRDSYEGAIVLPPKCAMYMDNPVACVDYASLYPSSMISQNLSHDSKVWTKEYNMEGLLMNATGEKDADENFIYDNLEEYDYVDIEFDLYKYSEVENKTKLEKKKIGKKVCRWAQLPHGGKSIMPSILEELLSARRDTRKLIKTVGDPFLKNILDKRQNGYKVTANSLYGQCGAKTSTFYDIDVAASTTSIGRMMIVYAQKMIETVYGNLDYETTRHGKVGCRAEYIYGDTDSVFFTFNLKNPNTDQLIRGKKALEITIEIAQDVAKLCTQFLISPMELSYEKTLMQFILLSKKRYVGILFETDPNKGKMKFMGLSIKRRDSCDYLKDTYGAILNILMKESNGNNNIADAITYLEHALLNLVNGTVPMDKLCITKALRGYYKKPQQIAHCVLAERIGRRDAGNKPKTGERMKFVHFVNNDPKVLQGDRIETPDFMIKNKLIIDYSYYITNQLMVPLQQLFGLALEQIWEYKKTNQEKNKHSKELAAIKDLALDKYMKQKEKICSRKVKEILFDKHLQTVYNKNNKLQTMCTFYKTLS